MKPVVATFVCASIAALSITAGLVLAADPSEGPGTGIQQFPLASTDLGRHFDAMKGKNLKIGRFVVAPHVSGGEHSHKGHPEVVYVLKGSVVEHQGPNAKEYKAGQAFASNSDLKYPHRIENPNDTPSEVLVIEVETPAGK